MHKGSDTKKPTEKPKLKPNGPNLAGINCLAGTESDGAIVVALYPFWLLALSGLVCVMLGLGQPLSGVIILCQTRAANW